MPNLFELTENYRQVYDLITQSDDNENDLLTDTLASIEDALEDKADGYVAVIKNLESDNEGITKEIKRLQARKKTNENGVKRLKESLQDSMNATGKTKFKTALNSFNIQKNPPSLDIKDEKHIPKEFWLSQAPKLNRKELLNYLKDNNEVKGVEIKQSHSLRVR